VCVTLSNDFVAGARGTRGEPVTLARHAVSGIRTGDVVERGQAVTDGVTVRILRGGKIIGHVTFLADGHRGWLLGGGSLCDGLGFTS
jgi:hypothetical protein